MKLGSQTASVINHLHSRAVKGQPAPFVGMGVTMLMWTDRSAGTIQEIIPATRTQDIILRITGDESKLVSGSTMSEEQQYEFTPRNVPGGSYFRQTVNGMWEQITRTELEWDDNGHPIKWSSRWKKVSGGGGMGLRLGERDQYRDPCF